MNNKSKLIILFSIAIIASASVSSVVTDMLSTTTYSTTVIQPAPQERYTHKTGILPQHDGEFPLDDEYVMRHAYVSSDINTGNTHGYEDLDDRINAMRDYEYVSDSFGWNTPEWHDFTWDKFHADIPYIQENSNSPYYRDALEAYADARGNVTEAIQIINEAHPRLLSAENFEFEIFDIIIEMPDDWGLRDLLLYDVVYGGTVTGIQSGLDGASVILSVDMDWDGHLFLEFASELNEGMPEDFRVYDFLVLVDDEEVYFEETDSNTIKIDLPRNASKVEIINLVR